jgi:alkylation response protein AidB-like acyl-CoA dehydrogenase
MNFGFSEEQEQFREIVRRFAEQRWSLEGVSTLAGTDDGEVYDSKAWQQASAELGLAGLLVPERLGGAGFGYLEMGIALEELGRQLAGGPLWTSACLATGLLLELADEEALSELMPPMAAGEQLATVDVAGYLAVADGKLPTLEARPGEAGGWQIDGSCAHVPFAAQSDLLLLWADHEGDAVLFAVASDARGLTIKQTSSLDLTRSVGDLVLSAVPARRLALASGKELTARALDRARAAMTAEQVGAAEACQERAIAWAKERMQFSRTIGSFQAVKHRLADGRLYLELARSAAYWAWWAADEDAAELVEAAPLARSMCCDAFARTAADLIHLHGGMGFTWEHSAHHFYRRARSQSVLLGDAQQERQRLADSLLAG